MDTPICDFVRGYVREDPLRLHMPGHKGGGTLGIEHLDLTEVEGADSLYEAGGIIRQSEENASALFGCPTFYSTEGSSQCIRAMLYLAMVHSGSRRVLAARNVHKTFLSAAAMLDLDVQWLWPRQTDSYLSCVLDAPDVERALKGAGEKPAAVYLTSPDYLGSVTDIGAVAEVCRKHGVLLLVDNAHGAYLRFLQPSRHPMDLGADLCCDSAHKTLPVLTGGAYLHIAAPGLAARAKDALALFGSTSPSYLILQSLDAANAGLSGGYSRILAEFVRRVAGLREALNRHGCSLRGQEPLKITIAAKPWGYTGRQLADVLLERNIVCEFSDPDYLVMMLTPETGAEGLRRLEEVLLSIPKRPAITEKPPRFHPCEQVLSIREAIFSPSETVPVSESTGRILAAPSVGCPPAVPIAVCGELLDEAAAACFRYYGIGQCTVIKY